MLSLNPTCSEFQIRLPIDFIPEHIREKYDKKISKYNNQIMKNITSIMNESICEVTLLGLGSHLTEQQMNVLEVQRPNRSNLTGYNYRWIPAGGVLGNMVNLDFSITFRIGSGFLNYFAMYETIQYYHSLYQSQNFQSYPVIPMTIYNEYREQIGTIRLFDVIPDSMEQLTFAQSKDPGRETFQVNFAANNIDIDLFDPTLDEELDYDVILTKDDINNNYK